MLTISFFDKRDLEWYSCSGKMSRFDKLILGVCLLHPVFLSNVLSDVTGVIGKYSVDSALLPMQFCLGLLYVSFLRQKIWDIFMIHLVYNTLKTEDTKALGRQS